MVDATLVLLCVFLAAQPFARSAPGAAARPPGASAPDLQLTLELRADGSDALNHQPVPRAQLPLLLGRLYRSHPDRPLFLQIAPDRRYGDVLDVRALARAAGIRVVAVVPPPASRPPGPAAPLD